MKKISLKDGREAVIRKAKKDEAQIMVDFYNKVGGETDFLSFGENEFSMGVNDYGKYIESTNNENNSIILIAMIDDELVSIASVNSNNHKNRIKHVGVLGIVIAEQFCGLGLGRELMDYLIEWTKANGITKRISLVTREDNTRAIELYKKVGFKEEGLLIKENFINGVFYNTLMMGLII